MIAENKLNRIINRIKKECDCKGVGCNKCVSKSGRIKLYAQAQIPVLFWEKPFKGFEGDKNFAEKIRNILRDFDSFYDKGKSVAFVGNLGTGKTFAACSILRQALVNRYSALYYNMSDMISLSISNSEDFYGRVTNVDILCIDEYDARWVFPSEKAEKLFGQVMERVLRSRFQNGLPTIICSNTFDVNKVLSNEYSKPVDSLICGYAEIIYVAGKDFRKKQI